MVVQDRAGRVHRGGEDGDGNFTFFGNYDSLGIYIYFFVINLSNLFVFSSVRSFSGYFCTCDS